MSILYMTLALVMVVFAIVVMFIALLDWTLCRKVQELKALITEELRKK